MAKKITNSAFQTNNTAPKVGFNTVSNIKPATDSFEAYFGVKPLDKIEANRIEKLLVEGYQPGTIPEEQASKDVDVLKQITSEIKAISKQQVVLTGQRVYEAQELLKSYKDGTFSKWLESTFGERKTGYNYLNFFRLHKALPNDDLRERLKRFPQKSAYMLASKNVAIEEKTEIINEYSGLNHDELVILMQERFPAASTDKRKMKSSNDRLIAVLNDTYRKLQRRKDNLSDDNKFEIEKVSKLLASLVSDV